MKTFCIYNAAGINCTTEKELRELESSLSGAILTKSCTLKPRNGNPLPRYSFQEMDSEMGVRGISINSNGLCNLGYEFYKNLTFNKPYIISVAGLNLKDTSIILENLSNSYNHDLIEVNLSCPNIIGKSQIGYDLNIIEKYLNLITDKYQRSFGLKLSPFFDAIDIERIANLLNKYSLLKFVTCINSLGNGLMIDAVNDTTKIYPKNGLGGIGGIPCKPIGLSNVYQFRKFLRSDIQIIGCGGIFNGQDIYEYLLAGASAVQVGTALMENGVTLFEKLATELEEIITSKGITNVDEIGIRLTVLEQLAD